MTMYEAVFYFILLQACDSYTMGTKFNLFQPAGDSPTRKSFYDSIMCGCIPVIFEKGVRYPFQDIFIYERFTVFIDRNDIELHGKSVEDVLGAYSTEEIYELQKNLALVARYLQYGNYGYGEDAATLAIRTLLNMTM